VSAGAENLAEGGSEAAAQYVTEGEVNPGEVFLEMLAGSGLAATEAGVQVASGGDGTTQQARSTSSVQEVIQEAREQFSGSAEEVEASAQRPLADMDEQALQSAREQALEVNDQETVSLIDEEVQVRERAEADPEATEGAQPNGTGPTHSQYARRVMLAAAAAMERMHEHQTPPRLPSSRGIVRVLERAEQKRDLWRRKGRALPPRRQR